MTGVKRFEDLECWRKARKLCIVIHELCKKIEAFREFGLSNQMKDSSGSVMDNIAEGFMRGGNREFAQFLYISRGSGGELESQLYRALDKKAINEEDFNNGFKLSEDTLSSISSLIKHLQNNRSGGLKNY